MTDFSAEMIQKAKGAKSAKELFELAKAEGIDITEDEASLSIFGQGMRTHARTPAHVTVACRVGYGRSFCLDPRA